MRRLRKVKHVLLMLDQTVPPHVLLSSEGHKLSVAATTFLDRDVLNVDGGTGDDSHNRCAVQTEDSVTDNSSSY